MEGGTVSQSGTWFTDITFDEMGSHNVILEIIDDIKLVARDTLQINIGGVAPSINILYDQESCDEFSSTNNHILSQKKIATYLSKSVKWSF